MNIFSKWRIRCIGWSTTTSPMSSRWYSADVPVTSPRRELTLVIWNRCVFSSGCEYGAFACPTCFLPVSQSFFARYRPPERLGTATMIIESGGSYGSNPWFMTKNDMPAQALTELVNANSTPDRILSQLSPASLIQWLTGKLGEDIHLCFSETVCLKKCMSRKILNSGQDIHLCEWEIVL